MFDGLSFVVGVGEGGEELVEEASEREADWEDGSAECVGGAAHQGDRHALLPHLADLDVLQDGRVHPRAALQPPHLRGLADDGLVDKLVAASVRALEVTVGHIEAGAVLEAALLAPLTQDLRGQQQAGGQH